MSLHLYQRPAEGDLYVMNLGALAEKWRRKILAVFGFFVGSFEIPLGNLSWFGLQDFYNNRLGCRLVERTFSLPSWVGILYEFRLVRGGQEYRRTLDPDWWHNKVKTMYSYPSSEDDEQGNLTYNPAANSFQDDAQDFSDWQTLAGDAVYSITVINVDGTVAWGFLGVDFTTANPNDSINVFTDIEMGTAGWNGEVAAKVPSTYEVRNVVLSGVRQDTGFSENTDASAAYGTMEYILSLGGTTPEGATAIRDRELTEFAWPRSRKMGGGQLGQGVRDSGTVLEVSVAGFWTTLNWTYRTTSRVAAASDMINTLVGASEFVTAGRVETNYLPVKVDCNPIPQRLGDLCEDKILEGGFNGVQWQGGVHADRKFVYEPAPTSAAFFLRSDGTLAGLNGQPIVFPLFRPGVLIKDSRAPLGGQPAGGAARDDPRIGYVEEVEWRSDKDELRYRIQGQEESVAVLRAQLQAGSF